MAWWRKLLNLPPTGTNWRQPVPQEQQRVADVPWEERVPANWQPWWGPQPGQDSNPGYGPGPAPTAQPSPPLQQQYMSAGPPSAPPAAPAEPAPGRDPQPTRRGATDPAPPWVPVEVRASKKAWAYTLRTLIVAVLLFVLATGVRAIFFPYGFGGAPDSGVDAVTTFPAGEASQVAARFTTSYLTWDERKRDDRARAVALDLAKGLDTGIGWSGQGVQAVRGVYPGQVKITDARTAHVIVLARVVPFKGSGQRWAEKPAVWQRLSVPVEVGPGRVVVSGAPAYVPEAPGEGASRDEDPVNPDDGLTTSTEADARAFFEAYATSDEATAAITAPKAQIHSLRGAVDLHLLKSWSVETGTGDRRTASATVTWKVTGSTAELDQDYRLTLLRSTAADGTERWQVAELTNN